MKVKYCFTTPVIVMLIPVPGQVLLHISDNADVVPTAQITYLVESRRLFTPIG